MKKTAVKGYAVLKRAGHKVKGYFRKRQNKPFYVKPYKRGFRRTKEQIKKLGKRGPKV
jgi:hypothetical protein